MNNNIFKPAWWLPGPHLQTLWPTLISWRRKKLTLRRERIELADGDFIDLDWCGDSGPIVILLHGLEGSAASPYAQAMLQQFIREEWRGVVMHFRGCSGENNRLPRTYHSGETQDLATIVKILHEREPHTAIAALGFSLGGNVLLKWMGETGAANPLRAAVAVSVPFELQKSAMRLQQGFSRFYQWYFLRCLRRKIVAKFSVQSAPFPLPVLQNLKSIHEFDDKITAPLHGFQSGEDYYKQSSSRQYLKKITIPTLLIQALDDPFMNNDSLPTPAELAASVQLEVQATGGHVGFISGNAPWLSTFWVESRIISYLRSVLDAA